MWSGLGAIIGGLLMGGGSIASGAMGMASSDRAAKLGYRAQQEINALNYQMFKENQQWQTQLANTAHQREVSDLRAAGLNPILSATGGSGAVTPNIATPSAVSPGSPVADKAALYQGMISNMLNSVSTASDIYKKMGEFEKNIADAKKSTSLKKYTDKVTDTEVGKRGLISYLDNQIRGNLGNLGSSAKQVTGILGDLMRAGANNFKVFKQTLFRDFRQQQFNNNNTAVRDPAVNLETY